MAVQIMPISGGILRRALQVLF